MNVKVLTIILFYISFVCSCKVTTVPDGNPIGSKTYKCKASCNYLITRMFRHRYLTCRHDSTVVGSVICACVSSECYPLPLFLGC
jgi:hypothetical protein